jgi:hypothetical protein
VLSSEIPLGGFPFADDEAMKYLIRNKNFYGMLLMDATLIAVALILAYILRFDGSIPSGQLRPLQNWIFRR